MKVEDFLSSDKYITRKELVEKTGLSDREVRNQISELKKERVVIYSSKNNLGYRLAKPIQNMNEGEMKKEKELITHSLNECKSRSTILRKQMRKYIAYLKKMEQFENNNSQLVSNTL